jgi:hypothetical protein
LDKTQNINNPVNIKPKLLKAFTGSLNIEELTLSHHLEASPTTAPASKEGITPRNPKTT